MMWGLGPFHGLHFKCQVPGVLFLSFRALYLLSGLSMLAALAETQTLHLQP